MEKIVWNFEAVQALYEKPFMDLLLEAQLIHRQHFDPNTLQVSSLLSVKTGACPEDCGYCSQSGFNKTALKQEKLLPVETVLLEAKKAKERGATRFCIAGAWRSPPAKAMPELKAMIEGINALNLESCLSGGMLDKEQAQELKAAGLNYYNHNLDTSREFYPNITKTRTYDDRLNTLKHLRETGIKTCCGGIIGLGEHRDDRIKLLMELANLPEAPESVPINQLIPVPGTPLENVAPISPLEFVRTIAVARILMPKTVIRLSAGRHEMSNELQTLCFFAGANSIFLCEVLLTMKNASPQRDEKLLEELGLTPWTEVPC